MKIDGKWLWMFGFLLLMLIVLPGIANAQGIPDPGDCLEPDLYCPIDSGLLFLIVAGIGFGAKKAYDNTKKKPVPSL